MLENFLTLRLSTTIERNLSWGWNTPQWHRTHIRSRFRFSSVSVASCAYNKQVYEIIWYRPDSHLDHIKFSKYWRVNIDIWENSNLLWHCNYKLKIHRLSLKLLGNGVLSASAHHGSSSWYFWKAWNDIYHVLHTPSTLMYSYVILMTSTTFIDSLCVYPENWSDILLVVLLWFWIKLR